MPRILTANHHVQLVYVNFVDVFRRVKRHQSTLRALLGLFRQRLVSQHAERITHCCILLQTVPPRVPERQLHEALCCISLDGAFDSFGLVEVTLIAHVCRVMEQGLEEQLGKVRGLDEQVFVGICTIARWLDRHLDQGKQSART